MVGYWNTLRHNIQHHSNIVFFVVTFFLADFVHISESSGMLIKMEFVRLKSGPLWRILKG